MVDCNFRNKIYPAPFKRPRHLQFVHEKVQPKGGQKGSWFPPGTPGTGKNAFFRLPAVPRFTDK
ncbi:MAG: hypothetical protein AVDCRST_MAG56-1874 [uncultured Cytophagales bacterium]|uniref:Uncharacterized protein n=1 Tax=uncultured Cytophagales bacterium TaxID=158755 RepID=A0A6J4IEP2_9SPHI|nr:MAG: hypothetical protein AVDCRST_MAG56-1874 [uncultured Cytophagales bacterium]